FIFSDCAKFFRSPEGLLRSPATVQGSILNSWDPAGVLGIGYALGFGSGFAAGLASLAAADLSSFLAGGFASFAGAGLASSFFSVGFASAFFSAAGFGALAAGAAGFSSSLFFFATLWSFGSIRFFKYAGTIPAAFSSV